MLLLGADVEGSGQIDIAAATAGALINIFVGIETHSIAKSNLDKRVTVRVISGGTHS